jgi:hypothetical protein
MNSTVFPLRIKISFYVGLACVACVLSYSCFQCIVADVVTKRLGNKLMDIEDAIEEMPVVIASDLKLLLFNLQNVTAHRSDFQAEVADRVAETTVALVKAEAKSFNSTLDNVPLAFQNQVFEAYDVAIRAAVSAAAMKGQDAFLAAMQNSSYSENCTNRETCLKMLENYNLRLSDTMHDMGERMSGIPRTIAGILEAASTASQNAVILACVQLIFVVVSHLLGVKRDLERLRAGDYWFDTDRFPLEYSPDLIGLVVGNTILSYFCSFLCWWIIMFIVVWEDSRNAIWSSLLVVLASSLSYVIALLTKKVVIGEWLSNDGHIKPRRLKLFSFFDTVFIYWYAFSGLTGAALRFVYLFVFAIPTMARADMTPYPVLKSWDPFYRSYISALLLYHRHSHPVVLCFVDALNEVITTKNDDLNATLNEGCSSSDANFPQLCRTSQIQRRWRLMMMLVRNPRLCEFRKHRLSGNLAGP